MLISAVLWTVRVCTRHPWPVIVIAAVLAIISAVYTATHFAITTDTDQLLPKDLQWRQHELAYREAFPQDQILVVVQGPTTELVEMAADRLAAELRTRHDRFSSVRRPQGSDFLQRSALLFPPVDQVTDTVGWLGTAKPLIEVLATDPSLRGVMHALTIGIGAGQARRMSPDTLLGPMNMLSDTLDDLFVGRFPSFSWRVLMNGKPAAPDELRGFIQIQPKLDFSALEPGRAAIDTIRQAADALKLGTEFGATVRLTGQVAINDEQFVLLGKGMLPNLIGTILAVLFILWLALRSAHTNLAVFISLCVGFVVTAAAGLLMVGAFNLISVAFGILFIGLGADFCIQFTVRYRSERHERDEVRAALRGAAARGRRAPGAGRRRHHGRILLVRANSVPRHRRARPDRRVRHDGRVPHHHHPAASAADRLRYATRTGADGLRRARAGRPIPGPAPHRRRRGNHHLGAGRYATAVTNPLRF